MPQCLFCLKEGEGDAIHFTDEHIFPAALGGNLVVKDGSCVSCNHGNSKFEQALAGELTPMRMLLQIPDRYGKVPHTTATIVTPEKTYDGRVKGDGSVIVKPLVTEEKNEKRRARIRASVPHRYPEGKVAGTGQRERAATH